MDSEAVIINEMGMPFGIHFSAAEAVGTISKNETLNYGFTPGSVWRLEGNRYFLKNRHNLWHLLPS